MTYVIGLPCVEVKGRACVDECPVEAIYYEDELQLDNEQFFTDKPASHDHALGSPGGAANLGSTGIDTSLVAALPPQSS
jgi:ferredoxin